MELSIILQLAALVTIAIRLERRFNRLENKFDRCPHVKDETPLVSRTAGF